MCNFVILIAKSASKTVRITCRPPPDAALVLKVLEKSVPPIFMPLLSDEVII